MSARSLQDAAAAPAALTAFLRGVERRGAVFAQLMAGSVEAGDQALAAAMRAFGGIAARAPFVEWPRRFWALLLASPLLRQMPPSPVWAPPFSVLAGLGSGPRAVLLLRLVAGLSEVDAAAVLGIARSTYRLALQRALPHRVDGAPDVAVWHALGDAAQAAVRSLSAERLAHLARQREAAIHGLKPVLRQAQDERGSAHSPPRWWRPALWSVAAITVLAIAATFWLPPGDAGTDVGSRITIEALPPAEAPAATFEADAVLPTHAGLDLLLAAGDGLAGFAAIDPEALDPRAVDPALDPGFYAWYAAQSAAQRSGDDAQPLPIEDADMPRQNGASETSDAPD